MQLKTMHPLLSLAAPPVGMGLAIDLGLRGVRSIVVERYNNPQPIPKGQNLTQRTLEHFYFWGAEAELRAARTIPSDYGIGGVTSYGTLLSSYSYDWLQRERVRPFYFTDNERLPQYATEVVLRRRAEQIQAIQTLYGWTCLAIRQDNEGVNVDIIDRDKEHALCVPVMLWDAMEAARSCVRRPASPRPCPIMTN